jgi:hypothetical protein
MQCYNLSCATVGLDPSIKHKSYNALISSSRVHLSAEGYHIIFDEVMHIIGVNWPGQTPERLPYVFPLWNEFSRREKALELNKSGSADAGGHSIIS